MGRWVVMACAKDDARMRRLLGQALLLCLALSACAGTAQGQATSVAPATITLPPQLAGYHVFVSDLNAGYVAEVGVHTYPISASVHGLGLSHDGRWLYTGDVADNQLVAYPFNGARLGTPHRVAVADLPRLL